MNGKIPPKQKVAEAGEGERATVGETFQAVEEQDQGGSGLNEEGNKISQDLNSIAEQSKEEQLGHGYRCQC